MKKNKKTSEPAQQSGSPLNPREVKVELTNDGFMTITCPDGTPKETVLELKKLLNRFYKVAGQWYERTHAEGDFASQFESMAHTASKKEWAESVKKAKEGKP